MDIDLDTFNARRSIAIAWQALLRHIWIVVIACVVTLGVMLAYMRYFPPVFQSTVRVLVQSERDPLRDDFYENWQVFRGATDGPTEVDMLKVAPVLEKVIKDLDLSYDDVYHPFLRHAVYLWGESWVGRNYRRVKHFFFPPKKSLYEATPEEMELGKSILDFRAGISVQKEGDSRVGVIQVLGPSQRVVEMADLLVDAYIENRNIVAREEAMMAYNILTEQVEAAAVVLDTEETALQAFSEKHGISFDYDKERRQVLDWAGQENTLMDVHAQIKRQEARLVEIERQLEHEPKVEILARSLGSNSVKTKLRDRLSAETVALVDIRNRYIPDSTEIQEKVALINELREMIANAEDMVTTGMNETPNPVWDNLRAERSHVMVELADLRVAETEQVKILKQYGDKMKDLPSIRRIGGDLTRRQVAADMEYTFLRTKQRQAYISGISELRGLGSVRVVEQASVPDKPIRPKKKLYILTSLLVGLLLGIGAAMAVDFVDDRIHNKEELEKMMGTEVYAHIPLELNGNKNAGHLGLKKDKGEDGEDARST